MTLITIMSTATPRVTPSTEIKVITETNVLLGRRYRSASSNSNGNPDMRGKLSAAASPVNARMSRLDIARIFPHPPKLVQHEPSPVSEMKRLNSFTVSLLTFVLAFSGSASIAADSNSLAVATGQTEATNAQETLRAYLQLQEQLRVTRLAIEHDRLEAEAASARSAEALASRLQAIEQSLASQRARELEVMQSSNRLMLVVAATLAGAGLLTILLMAYSHWRTLNRLAEIAGAFPAGPALRVGPALPALDSGESRLVAAGPAEQSNLRLLDAVERLEKRLFELEHTAGSEWSEAAPANNGPKGIPIQSSAEATAPPEEAVGVTDAARITSLLGKG